MTPGRTMPFLMPVRIQSFLRKEDETLVPIQEWDAVIADPDYLEGALELTVNGVPLISPVMWDYIDELWAYIITTLRELVSDGSSYTYFTDQPIKLEMEKTSSGMVKVSISSRSGKFNNSTQISEDRLVLPLLDEGEQFFLKMQELEPEGQNHYEGEIKRIKSFRSGYKNCGTDDLNLPRELTEE